MLSPAAAVVTSFDWLSLCFPQSSGLFTLAQLLSSLTARQCLAHTQPARGRKDRDEGRRICARRASKPKLATNRCTVLGTKYTGSRVTSLGPLGAALRDARRVLLPDACVWTANGGRGGSIFFGFLKSKTSPRCEGRLFLIRDVD